MPRLLRWSGLSFEWVLSSLLMLYLISTAFLEFPLYPPWSHRVQPPELIFGFLLALICLGLATQKIKIRTSWNGLDLAVGMYLFINVISAFIHSDQLSWLELLGKTYLVGVYILFKWAIAQKWIDWRSIVVTMEILAITLISMTALAYFLWSFGKENPLVVKFTDYPYFGTVYRAKGTLQTPSMYISLVNWCFLFLLVDLYQFKSNHWRRWFLLVGLGLCAILSFSKAVLLLLLTVIVIGVFQLVRKKVGWGVAVVSGIMLLLYLAITHLVFVDHPKYTRPGDSFLAVEDLPSSGESLLIPSSYFALKKAAWITGIEHPFLGVGPGNFNANLQQLREQGRFPAHLPLYDPHSVYFGAFAETGTLGLLSVVTLVLVAFRRTGSMNASNPFRLCLLLWLILFTIEGFSGDLMNFRHYWIQFGLIGGLLINSD